MLTMVKAMNSKLGVLELPLLDSSGGYSVKDIQGLDPVKATLVSTQLAQQDGGQLHNARREPRNITMKLGIESDYITNTVAGLRMALYDFFMPKLPITLGFYFDDILVGSTDVVVESAEANMFSADPEIAISAIAYDPDFYAPDPVIVSGTTTNTLTTTAINYSGNSDAGIIFTLTFPGTASALKLYNTRPDNVTQIIDLVGSFIASDQLIINTIPGQKAITIIRSGLQLSALSYMKPSQWISLMAGQNDFRAYYTGSGISYTVQYTPKYGGF
jgi:hypothetical protein